jgi:ABC-type antimicrobial peptide transport system permease subunit
MSTGVAIFDAERYFSIAKPDQAAFVDGDPGSALSALVSERAVIMTQSFANQYAYGRGDQITMTFQSGGSIRFNIVAIVKYLPGLSGSGYGGPYYNGYSFFVHMNQIPYSDRGTPTMELFDIDDPSIPKAAEHLRDNYGGSITVMVYNEEIASIRENPISGATYNFLNLEYAFALVVIAIGLGMIMFMAMIERKQEVANMIARGASIKDIMALTSGEGITIGLVGLLLGSLIGLSTAYVFNTMFGMMFNAGSIVPRVVMVSWGSLWVILATVGILLLTSVLILIPLKRINLNEILRWRGG